MSESAGIENLVDIDHVKADNEQQKSHKVNGVWPKLRVQHISKSFQSKNGRAYVLEDINLEIQQGEFVCIVGPSGCGKTTNSP